MTIDVADFDGARRTVLTAADVVAAVAVVAANIGELNAVPAEFSVNARLKDLNTNVAALTAAVTVWGVELAALNANTAAAGVYPSGQEGESVVASQTDQILGGAGAVGDRLNFITIQPATTSPGVVTVKDGATTIYTFPGGASSVGSLVPFTVVIDGTAATRFTITTGANVSVRAVGDFT